jgi:hypothetical protein
MEMWANIEMEHLECGSLELAGYMAGTELI